MYRDLLNRLQALEPMCHFDVPNILCDDDVLYYRNLYLWTNLVITDMVNLACRHSLYIPTQVD